MLAISTSNDGLFNVSMSSIYLTVLVNILDLCENYF